jgi:hypothetical protein
MTAFSATTKNGVVVSPEVWAQMQSMLSLLTQSKMIPGTMPTSNNSSHQLPSSFPLVSNTPIIFINPIPDSVIPDKDTTSQHQDPSLQSALAPPLNKINLPDNDNVSHRGYINIPDIPQAAASTLR